MAADRAGALGLPLATLSPETKRKLERVLPANWSHGNPIDVIGDAGPERYRAAITACLEDRGVDGIVVILTPQAMTAPDDAAAAVIGAAAGSSKPVITCWMGEASVGNARRKLMRAGLTTFDFPEMAVEAFAYIAAFYRNQRLLLEAPPPMLQREPADLEAARRIVQAAIAEGRSVLGATESKHFLAAFRIPVAHSVNAASEDEAVAAAEREGYPIVMKIHSPDITHKSDVGGVRLGLANAQAVREAYVYMMTSVKAQRPDARVTGVSVERMISRGNGRELMVGVTRDPVFGPAITFGAGGIAVEVLRDRAVALPPLNAALVSDMIGSTRIAKMLDEFRSLPAVDRPALEALLLRVSEIACEMPEVTEIDINPVVADENGVLALDARVVVEAVAEGAVRYGHLAIHPYPSELETKEELPDGTPYTLRPIRPEDAAIEMEFVDGLSPESRRLRFQSALRGLTPAMLARFTQIDYDREMAFIAVDDRSGVEHEVGVARYMLLPDARSCEFAVVIADTWQGKGLGHRMMERIIEIARSRGVEEMIGWVLTSNKPMLDMVQNLGFKVAAEPEDPLNRRVTLQLRSTAEERVAAD
jgi:acetyltransferase